MGITSKQKNAEKLKKIYFWNCKTIPKKEHSVDYNLLEKEQN